MKISEIWLGPEAMKVRWAVESDIKHATPTSKLDQNDDDNVVAWVDIKKLVDATDPKFRVSLDDPSGGENAVDGRIHRALAHWEDGGYMDPPLINVFNDAVYFTDGRHRIAGAYQQGNKYGPIVIPRSEAQKLRELLGGSVWSQRPLDESLPDHQ